MQAPCSPCFALELDTVEVLMILVEKMSTCSSSGGLLPQALEQKHLVLNQNIVQVFGDAFGKEDLKA